MGEYLSPGVYMEEVDRGPKPIEAVGTAMPVFVGFTEKEQTSPQLVTNWSQYVENFGGYIEGAYLPHAVYGYFLNGGTRCYVLSVKSIPKAEAKLPCNKEGLNLTVRAKQATLDAAGLSVTVTNAARDLKSDTGTNGGKPIAQAGRAQETESVTNKVVETPGGKEGGQTQQPESVTDTVVETKGAKAAAKPSTAALATPPPPQAIVKVPGDKPAEPPAVPVPPAPPTSGGETETQNSSAGETPPPPQAQSEVPGDKSPEPLAVQVPAAPTTPAGETKTQNSSAGEGLPQEGTLFDITVKRQVNGKAETETARNLRLLRQTRTVEGQKVTTTTIQGLNLKWIDIILPDSEAELLEDVPLADLQPQDQQVTLTLQETPLALPKYGDFQGDEAGRKGLDGLAAYDDITMVCVPDLMSVAAGSSVDRNMVKAVQTMLIAHCERTKDRVAILDAPPGMSPMEVKKWRMETMGFDSSYAALYYPWIEIADPVTGNPLKVPPCGHVAGIWARSDSSRGVHKAPANEVVRGAIGLAWNCTKGEQDTLNPNEVNCIRQFPGMGIRVWGARTLSHSNPAWKYINVRRLFNMVEKSIERSTQWVVFEPNDPTLWAQVTRDVSSFLSNVWVSGALFGRTPEEAFYVKCDEELNPPQSRDLGRLIIEIGMCPVKPAEFVIFRISQWAGPSA